MLQPATKPEQPRRSGWTPARRAAQAEAIKRWRPWTRSTGPRTAAGKARAAQNAAKPWAALAPDRIMQRALAVQAHYITDVKRYIALKEFPFKNELMKRRVRRMRKSLIQRGHLVTAALIFALRLQIMQKPCFLEPFAANS